MRKFNLKDHAAKRMMDLEKAGRSGQEKPEKVPELAEAAHPVNTDEMTGIRMIW